MGRDLPVDTERQLSMGNTVWLLNGIPGSGKTTTASALAARFQRAAHIEGDRLQHMVVSGSVPPGAEPGEESSRQVHLCVRNQCLLARSFLDAGFVPVIDYVVINRERLGEYRSHLPGIDLRLVTLRPGAEVALQRDRERPEKTVAAAWVHLAQEMDQDLYPEGLWIDNSRLTLVETVDQILDHYGG